MRLCTIAMLATVGFTVSAAPASAGAFHMQLNCILNTLDDSVPLTPCTPTSSSFGTITLEDVADNGIKVTVDLAGTGQKFRDLMLNYADAPVAVTDNDPSNTISITNNGYSINPYDGGFDVGGSGGQGWSGSDPYSVILKGVTTTLLLDKFKVKDSLGQVYAGIHIQNIGSATGGDCDGSGEKDPCVPGMTGKGSLKIGATTVTDGVPDPAPVPDGGLTVTLLGGSLIALSALRRRLH